VRINGNPDGCYWRFWWINDGDEPINTRLHWIFREKLYGKAWSGWKLKINDITIPLEPNVDAELSKSDILPMKVYAPTGQLVWQYMEYKVQLYVDGVLMDEIDILIDNDALRMTVESVKVIEGWDVAVMVNVKLPDGTVRSAMAGEVEVNLTFGKDSTGWVDTGSDGMAVFTYRNYGWLYGTRDGTPITVSARFKSYPDVSVSKVIYLGIDRWWM